MTSILKRLICCIKGHRKGSSFDMGDLHEWCPRCGKLGKVLMDIDELVERGILRRVC